MTNEHDWSFELAHEGARVVYRWRERVHNGRSYGYYGEFVVPGTEDAVTQWTESFNKQAATFAVQSFRRGQLAEILPDRDGSDFDFSVAILDLYRLNLDGVYLAQGSGNQTLYVGDVAAILGVDVIFALKAVEALVEDGSLGLNGFILTSNEEYEAAFAHWLEGTGHYRLFMGDSGIWSCAACGQNGDEQDDPRTFDCVR